MPIYLNSNQESLIQFQEGLPVNYSGPLLRGSNALYSAKDTCQLITHLTQHNISKILMLLWVLLSF